ncbi:uncharacterized protein IL334_005103 [Kwoniella shivajii]|uniref:Uncharacterized protein n=1 Tax=Kwoniella shivajii TaxID=564305 RepID=A0ABZ1D2T5_9TREE|nr:hypothetical protein IL334_005103 [Kwoniella shivajii]
MDKPKDSIWRDEGWDDPLDSSTPSTPSSKVVDLNKRIKEMGEIHSRTPSRVPSRVPSPILENSSKNSTSSSPHTSKEYVENSSILYTDLHKKLSRLNIPKFNSVSDSNSCSRACSPSRKNNSVSSPSIPNIIISPERHAIRREDSIDIPERHRIGNDDESVYLPDIEEEFWGTDDTTVHSSNQEPSIETPNDLMDQMTNCHLTKEQKRLISVLSGFHREGYRNSGPRLDPSDWNISISISISSSPFESAACENDDYHDIIKNLNNKDIDVPAIPSSDRFVSICHSAYREALDYKRNPDLRNFTLTDKINSSCVEEGSSTHQQIQKCKEKVNLYDSEPVNFARYSTTNKEIDPSVHYPRPKSPLQQSEYTLPAISPNQSVRNSLDSDTTLDDGPGYLPGRSRTALSLLRGKGEDLSPTTNHETSLERPNRNRSSSLRHRLRNLSPSPSPSRVKSFGSKNQTESKESLPFTVFSPLIAASFDSTASFQARVDEYAESQKGTCRSLKYLLEALTIPDPNLHYI